MAENSEGGIAENSDGGIAEYSDGGMTENSEGAGRLFAYSLCVIELGSY